VEVKTIKIKLTVPFWYNSKTRDKDAVIDIDPKDFNPAFMVKVEQTKPIETPKTEVVATAPVLLTVEPLHTGGPTPLEEQKPKPKQVLNPNAH
jgi:hypothetical protein